tara:strand:- start:7899 stop:9764 length:1866 start_codon:yes stop_codon:yes gene_type:complete
MSNKYEFVIQGKDGTKAAFSSLQSSILTTTKAATGLAAAFGLNELRKAADEWTTVNNKLRLVTDSEENLIDTRTRLLSLASETRTELETTVSLYARLQRATEDAGISQNELFQITEAINQSFAISGATVAETTASVTQLTQALGSGVLRGQEFNSISEQAPRLLKALTDSLNVTRGELRQMANDGVLTSDIVIEAIKGSSNAIANEFATAIPTASQALTVFGTSLTVAIGKLDEATGASNALSNAILGISEAITDSVGGDTVDGLTAKLQKLIDKKESLGETNGPTQQQGLAGLNVAISETEKKLEKLKAQLSFDKNYKVGIDLIFEGTDITRPDDLLDDMLGGAFSNLSGTAGGVGQDAAKAYADGVWSAFQEQLEFNQESSEIANMLSSGLFTIDLDSLDASQQAERDMWAAHYEKLSMQAEESAQRRLLIQQGLEASAFNIATAFASNTASMIEGAAREGSKAQKAAFVAQQIIAAATTVMNAEMASIAVLAPPPVGLGPVAGAPYSTFIKGAGYVSAGIIAAQTIGSFEGGGYIPNGPRSGGLDGRGGQLAMVHPNESIIDHNLRGNTSSGKSAGQPMQITFAPVINSSSPEDWMAAAKKSQKQFVRMLRPVLSQPL